MAINSKWIFALKKNELGQIESFKARLVAKGCNQKFGVDYNETFSPVVRYSTIRLILVLAVDWKMYLHHIDISSAYLNSAVPHEVYMRQPETFVDSKCKEWHEKLDNILKEIGFGLGNLASMKGELVLLAVYVDDILIGFRNESIIAEFPTIDKGKLHNNYISITIH